MTKPSTPSIDGRKYRWFDCDWNNDSIAPKACEHCSVCKYNNFLDFAHSVAPAGSHIEYNRNIDEYMKLRNLEDKKNWIDRYLSSNTTKHE